MWQGNFDGMFPFRLFWWQWILIVLAIEIVLKGMALYRSARNGQKYWFIAILIINTVGILPFVYLIWFADKKPEAPVKPPASPSRSKRGRNGK